MWLTALIGPAVLSCVGLAVWADTPAPPAAYKLEVGARREYLFVMMPGACRPGASVSRELTSQEWKDFERRDRRAEAHPPPARHFRRRRTRKWRGTQPDTFHELRRTLRRAGTLGGWRDRRAAARRRSQPGGTEPRRYRPSPGRSPPDSETFAAANRGGQRPGCRLLARDARWPQAEDQDTRLPPRLRA